MTLERSFREDPSEIASIIDHTNVNPSATEDDIRDLCEEVVEYGFCSAVVVPYHAQLANELLGERANVVAVIGFPYGVQNSSAKRAEVDQVLKAVDEIDMVMHRTAFANGDHQTVIDDIEAVRELAGSRTIKCIIESPVLSTAEIAEAAALVADGGADYVKTAVGYDGPADPVEVETIDEATDAETRIKASGGISSFEEALNMVSAGARRIGSSSGVEIVESIE
jgi:deoxyribose-phosphate aldolase